MNRLLQQGFGSRQGEGVFTAAMVYLKNGYNINKYVILKIQANHIIKMQTSCFHKIFNFKFYRGTYISTSNFKVS